MRDELDLSMFMGATTCAPQTQEPLTFERMQRTLQELHEQYPEPPVEILSPGEYLRRAGYRLPISEETLAELAPTTFSPIDYLMRYTFAVDLARIFGRNRHPMLGVISCEPSSPKTRNQLQREAARARRNHRARLRARRQRRAKQRRHRRGLA